MEKDGYTLISFNEVGQTHTGSLQDADIRNTEWKAVYADK